MFHRAVNICQHNPQQLNEMNSERSQGTNLLYLSNLKDQQSTAASFHNFLMNQMKIGPDKEKVLC